MQTKSIKIEFPDDLYIKIGVVASEHFKTAKDYVRKLVSDSIREEFELRDIKKQKVSKYAADEISYDSLKAMLGSKEAERIRVYKETILESFKEADLVSKRIKE